MSRGDKFELTPGPLPWRVACVKRKPRSGVVFAADNTVVCVARIANAREIVRMANLFASCKVEGK